MKISSQYRSQYLLNNEGYIKNKKIKKEVKANNIDKNEAMEKNNYLSNIMKQKQELNNRIHDIKDRQQLYTKKINEAIRNLSKGEIGSEDSNIEDEDKILDEYSSSLNTKEEIEILDNKEIKEKNEDEILENKKLEQLEKKDIEKESYKDEFENLLLEGKTREELEDMLKNFINMTQNEIKQIESNIEKLDKDSVKYKQNANEANKLNKTKEHVDILV